MDSGIAKNPITDWDVYVQQLEKRLGQDNQISRVIISKARKAPKRVVFADAENVQVLKAAQQVRDERIAFPILLGKEDKIRSIIELNGADLADIPIIDPYSPDQADHIDQYAEAYFKKRHRKGVNILEARKMMYYRSSFGAMMVEMGEADALISGLTRNYPDTIRPSLQIIGKEKGVEKVAGMSAPTCITVFAQRRYNSLPFLLVSPFF